MLWGFKAAIKLANDIGIERIEKRHRDLADYIHAEMLKRGAQSWTSPDPQMRCAIITVNVPPVDRMELENWMWKTQKIRMRGGQPSKLRLSTPYYVSKADLDRFLAAFDEFRKMKGLA
jgi:selenocysteine lyase/cysteine desulfurase